jgi:23S rRNA pseudoU1915 N3-methylase RlmH
MGSSILSCDGCAKGKKGKQVPIQEEKVFMEKLGRQVKPKVWKVMKQTIERNKQNKQAIEEEIKRITELLKIIGKVEGQG